MIKAVHDKLVLIPIEKEQESTIIFVPDAGKEIPEICKVVDVGPGRTTEFGATVNCHCKIGDIVLIPKAVANRVSDDGKDYFICRDVEVLCIIEKSK
jgi:chaperonin GroES